MISWTRVPSTESDGNTKFNEPQNFWEFMDIALVKDRASFYPGHWEDWNDVEDAYRVQLGAGRKLIRGWKNLDYPEWDGENGVIPCDDESVDHIASFFTLDHLSPQGVINTLAEVQRCLRIGGIFTNVVPHYSSQLAHECIQHRSQFGIDTWRNIFSERQYDHFDDIDWKLEVGFNALFGLTERNLVLVTQLHKVA